MYAVRLLLKAPSESMHLASMLNSLRYPLDFRFKVLALAPQFIVTDADGKEVAYIKQKLFKFKEEVKVYSDSLQTDLLYYIKADRWLDWSASYKFSNEQGADLGRVARHGAKSLWKASYDVIDAAGELRYTIRERSATTRFLDSLMGEIPVVGLATGYLFNPKYDIRDAADEIVAVFSKMPSAIGRRFQLETDKSFDEDAETQIVLSLMMMVLLERGRG